MNVCGTNCDTADGTALPDYIHVSDSVAAISARCDIGGWRIFDGSQLRLRRWVLSVGCDQHGVKFEGRRAGDLSAIIADAGRICSVVG
jgi:UDP-glucose 4-epimerase